MASDIPRYHRTLILDSVNAKIRLQTTETPRATHGSAVVRILAAQILSYHKDIYDGTRTYPFPTPIIPGCSAIARIVETGPDATILEAGQLVFVDCVIRARDDPSAIIMSAISDGSTVGSKKLMREIWRDGAFAEYRNVPLESCHVLNETVLCRELGYSPKELMYMATLLVPYGGFRDIGLEPGQTVIVCPATGPFGGAGVHVAAAMGCRAVAMGRNEQELERLKSQVESTMPRASVITVPISLSVEETTTALQAVGTIDAILDMSPPAAASSTHMTSALRALKHEGKVSMMGFGNVENSFETRFKLVGANITMRYKLMYERSDIQQFIKLLERGFPAGKTLVESKSFRLEEWEQAFECATKWTGIARNVVFEP